MKKIPKTTNCSHQKEIEQKINNYDSVALHVDDKSNPLEFYRDFMIQKLESNGQNVIFNNSFISCFRRIIK
jgi:hypothetical protein